MYVLYIQLSAHIISKITLNDLERTK